MIIPILAEQLDRLDRQPPPAVISWACPVPYFGHAPTAIVATVGINPSNREFVDQAGQELDGHSRRLPTLRSLGLQRWRDANSQHVQQVISSCGNYFRSQPYNRWFGVLERLLGPSGCTYYGSKPSACHLDLFAYATRRKWSFLPLNEQRGLIASSSQMLAMLLRSIRAEILILNGRSVVDTFEVASHTSLASIPRSSWDLPRSGRPVPGLAFAGTIDQLAGIPLGRKLTVVGFNHNIQSSFGVTSAVIEEIGSWLASVVGAGQ